jgi:hypothetical protein
VRWTVESFPGPLVRIIPRPRSTASANRRESTNECNKQRNRGSIPIASPHHRADGGTMTETSPYLFTGGTRRPAGPVPTKPSAWRQIGTTALGTAAGIILATVLMAAAALLGAWAR